MDLFSVKEKHILDMVIGKNIDGVLEKSELEEFVNTIEQVVASGVEVPPVFKHFYLLANVTLKQSNASNFALSYWNGVTDKCNNFIPTQFTVDLMSADAEGNYNGVAEFSEIVAYRMKQALVCDMLEGVYQYDDGTISHFQMLKCGLDFFTKDGIFFDAKLLVMLNSYFLTSMWNAVDRKFEQLINLLNGNFNPQLEWQDDSCSNPKQNHPSDDKQVFQNGLYLDPVLNDGIYFPKTNIKQNSIETSFWSSFPLVMFALRYNWQERSRLTTRYRQ